MTFAANFVSVVQGHRLKLGIGNQREDACGLCTVFPAPPLWVGLCFPPHQQCRGDLLPPPLLPLTLARSVVLQHLEVTKSISPQK